jgi:uncharacterized protein YcnI
MAFITRRSHAESGKSTGWYLNFDAGDYKVSWEGQGPEVNVTISQGKKTVVTAPARLVERESKAPRNAVVMRTNGGGTGSIVELQLAGKQSVLVFQKAATVAEQQAQ